MSVTYKDAMQFISDEIERGVATNFVNTMPDSVKFITRKIEILEKVREVLKGCDDEFDPELHKFKMTAIRTVSFSKEFVVEAADKHEAMAKLHDSFNYGEFLMDETVMGSDSEEFDIDDVDLITWEFNGEEITEGIWEV